MAGGTSVVIVIDSDDFGGTELMMTSIAKAIRGDDRYTVTAVLGDAAPPELRSRLASLDVEARSVRGFGRRSTPLGFLRLRSTLRKLEPTLVHVSCTDQGGGMAPVLAGWLLRKPVVATLLLVSPGRARWREAISRRVLALPRARIAISESVAAYLERRGLASTVVHIGVERPELRGDPRTELGIERDAFVIGGIGRLHEQKGWDVLCRASELVREAIPNARFVVIGRGPEGDRLSELGECASVQFVGYRDDAPSYLAAFDVLAVPSRYEGFGMVAVEAMLAGVPVVASRVGGLPEVVGDTGILVTPDRPDELAEALLRIAKDRRLREDLAERARQRAAERFGVDRMVKATVRVYESALPPSGPT